MNIKNKTIIVTEASDGIGKHVAFKLAREGVLLALVGRNKERLTLVKDECLRLGSPKVEYFVCDISKREDVKETTDKIINKFALVDILLNIAGIWQKLNTLENISDKEIDDVIDIDLKGTVYFTKHILKHFKAKGHEAIILNVSSRSGVTGQEKQNIYTAAKWGVTGFSESLKADLKGTKIRVATVSQGGTNTEMFNKTGERFEQEKFIKPEDLAEVIVFMLSRPPQIWLHDVRIEY